jgi:hypothetical protein
MTMQLFYRDVCNVSYKEWMIMYLMSVLYKENASDGYDEDDDDLSSQTR